MKRRSSLPPLRSASSRHLGACMRAVAAVPAQPSSWRRLASPAASIAARADVQTTSIDSLGPRAVGLPVAIIRWCGCLSFLFWYRLAGRSAAVSGAGLAVDILFRRADAATSTSYYRVQQRIEQERRHEGKSKNPRRSGWCSAPAGVV